MTHTAGNTDIGTFALTGDEYRVMVAMNLHGYRLVSATPAKVQTIVEMQSDFKDETKAISAAVRNQSELIERLEADVKNARGKKKAKYQSELTEARWKMTDICNALDKAWDMIRDEASNVLRSA